MYLPETLPIITLIRAADGRDHTAAGERWRAGRRDDVSREGIPAGGPEALAETE
jgi:hypothetical protein